MSELTASSTLAEWVATHPKIAQVMEAHRLDYCCGGNRSLQAACAERGLSAETVESELRSTIHATRLDAEPHADWSKRSLAELCDHIERSHHTYLRQSLPRLKRLLEMVVAAHGARHPGLQDVFAIFSSLTEELGPHLMKEEQILFPAIRRLEQEQAPPHFAFGTVQNPIHVMEHEHDAVGQLLHQLDSLTGSYTPPPDACESWRQLLLGLKNLELDLHQHIHKENNLLFPAAAKLESQKRGAM